MANETETALEGGCTCGDVRYRLDGAALIVHACHCRWCQRESGGAFAVNAMLETTDIRRLRGDTERARLPSASGKGQVVVRCAKCRITLWSHYAGGGEAIAFVRVGTLDTPDALPPDVHIFTASKQAWLALPEGAPAFEEFYDPARVWSPAALERYRAAGGGRGA